MSMSFLALRDKQCMHSEQWEKLKYYYIIFKLQQDCSRETKRHSGVKEVVGGSSL